MPPGRTFETAPWPALPLEGWSDTYATLHLWLQIVGKIRLVSTPALNHCWNVTLYVTSRGLTTGPMAHGERTFQIDFDFLDDRLRIAAGDGATGAVPLKPQTTTEFYRRLREELARMGLETRIYEKPNEVAEPIPFRDDELHASYDPGRRPPLLANPGAVGPRLPEVPRSISGQVQPGTLFLGGAELAVTRFSGRPAPPHPGGIPNLPDRVTRDAYSHEVSSAGFWPGGGPVPYPAYYSYAYPEPPGFPEAPVKPAAAFYSMDLHEFLLPYESVAERSEPRRSAAGVPAVDLRSRGEPSGLGAQDPRAQDRLSRAPLDTRLQARRVAAANRAVVSRVAQG